MATPAPSGAVSVLNINVGILGHVDSGKTSLVRALSTELSTAALDKHPQSQERGITLDLGFSAFTAPLPAHLGPDCGYSALQFTLVDCPGHASLIRTIIGGAQIIDMMILVIDIMKGIQTQTAECLVVGEITTDCMIVVLNKVDLLPLDGRAKRVDAVTSKIRKVFASTRFADAPFVVLSAAPGGSGKMGAAAPVEDVDAAGHKAQSDTVAELVEMMRGSVRLPARDGSGDFLFAVDHCFPIKGQGTVLTGTVLAGSAKLNDSVELPALRQVKKVKSMQMFKKPVALIRQGDRAGICVTGLDASLMSRGLLCAPATVPSVPAALALVKRIRFFKGNGASESKFHVTVGHSTVLATVVFFGAAELARADAATRWAADADAAAAAIVDEFDAAGAAAASAGPAAPAAGTTTAAGAAVAAARTSSRRTPFSKGSSISLSYDFDTEYEWQEELLGGRTAGRPSAAADATPDAAVHAAELVYEWQWAALLLDTPVLCPRQSMVIGSHLDGDVHGATCRLAFHGTLVQPLESADIHELHKLHLYKRRMKAGVVDRLEDAADAAAASTSVTVIGKSLFKKETDMNLFLGLRVYTRYGQQGVIDSSFGKSGKFKATFPDTRTVHVEILRLRAAEDAKSVALLESLGARASGALVTLDSPPPVKANDPILMPLRKYMYERREEGKPRRIRQ